MTSDFTKWDEVKLDTNDRDCANCKHYKRYKNFYDDDLYACESWECKYEPRDKED